MKKASLAFLIVSALCALILSACGQPAAPEPKGPTGDATAGKTKFESTCSSCHGMDAKGMPGLGKDLTISEFVKGKTDPEMVAFITTGRPATDPANTTKVDMPPKGGNPALKDTDIADIVAYVRSLQK